MSRRQDSVSAVVWPAAGRSAARSGQVKPSIDSWASRYVTRVRWTDAFIVISAVLIAQHLRLGMPEDISHASSMTSFIVTPCLIVAWILTLRATQSSDRRIVGDCPLEYSRVLNACFIVFGLLAIVDLAFRLSLACGFIAIALPLGTASLLVSQWAWRNALHRSRLRRRNLSQVLVVGGSSSAVPLIEHPDKNPGLGFEVVGLCVPPGTEHRSVIVNGNDISVYGCFSEARDAVARCGATTVAVTSAEALGHSAMRQLSWELEGMNVDMLVSPGVTTWRGLE